MVQFYQLSVKLAVPLLFPNFHSVLFLLYIIFVNFFFFIAGLLGSAEHFFQQLIYFLQNLSLGSLSVHHVHKSTLYVIPKKLQIYGIWTHDFSGTPVGDLMHYVNSEQHTWTDIFQYCPKWKGGCSSARRWMGRWERERNGAGVFLDLARKAQQQIT